MKDKLPLLETAIGIVSGIAALYGGILLSTTLPIPFVFYGLPLALLLACSIILFFIFLMKKTRYLSNQLFMESLYSCANSFFFHFIHPMDNSYRSLRKFPLKEAQTPTSFTVAVSTLGTPLTTLRITSPVASRSFLLRPAYPMSVYQSSTSLFVVGSFHRITRHTET